MVPSLVLVLLMVGECYAAVRGRASRGQRAWMQSSKSVAAAEKRRRYTLHR